MPHTCVRMSIMTVPVGGGCSCHARSHQCVRRTRGAHAAYDPAACTLDSEMCMDMHHRVVSSPSDYVASSWAGFTWVATGRAPVVRCGLQICLGSRI